MTFTFDVVNVDSSLTWKTVSWKSGQFIPLMIEFVIEKVVESRLNTMSFGAIVRVEKVVLSMLTSDSKLAKNEGYIYISQPFWSIILALINAMIDIFETATDFI